MQTLELDSLDLVDMVVLIDKNFGFTVTAKKILPVSKPSGFSIIWWFHMQKRRLMSRNMER